MLYVALVLDETTTGLLVVVYEDEAVPAGGLRLSFTIFNPEGNDHVPDSLVSVISLLRQYLPLFVLMVIAGVDTIVDEGFEFTPSVAKNILAPEAPVCPVPALAP